MNSVTSDFFTWRARCAFAKVRRGSEFFPAAGIYLWRIPWIMHRDKPERETRVRKKISRVKEIRTLTDKWTSQVQTATRLLAFATATLIRVRLRLHLCRLRRCVLAACVHAVCTRNARSWCRCLTHARLATTVKGNRRRKRGITRLTDAECARARAAWLLLADFPPFVRREGVETWSFRNIGKYRGTLSFATEIQ